MVFTIWYLYYFLFLIWYPYSLGSLIWYPHSLVFVISQCCTNIWTLRLLFWIRRFYGLLWKLPCLKGLQWRHNDVTIKVSWNTCGPEREPRHGDRAQDVCLTVSRNSRYSYFTSTLCCSIDLGCVHGIYLAISKIPSYYAIRHGMFHERLFSHVTYYCTY